jgi:hypothetical protein
MVAAAAVLLCCWLLCLPGYLPRLSECDYNKLLKVVAIPLCAEVDTMAVLPTIWPFDRPMSRQHRCKTPRAASMTLHCHKIRSNRQLIHARTFAEKELRQSANIGTPNRNMHMHLCRNDTSPDYTTPLPSNSNLPNRTTRHAPRRPFPHILACLVLQQQLLLC